MLSISKQGGRFFEKKAICSLVAVADGPIIKGRKENEQEEEMRGDERRGEDKIG